MWFKRNFAAVALILVTGFHGKAQNVYFREMRIKPSVSFADDRIFVYASNSVEHASVFIYRLFIAVDNQTRSVYISAYQATGQPYKTQFPFDPKYYHINDPGSYKYFWLDPDRKKTQIDIITTADAEKYNN